jgi:hypothetical protein
MQLLIPDIEHAETGYPGSAWPSAYNVAKWSFGVERNGGEGERGGMWVLEHGMGHGEWVVAPIVGYDEEKWRIYWWNGEFRDFLVLRRDEGMVADMRCRNG